MSEGNNQRHQRREQLLQYYGTDSEPSKENLENASSKFEIVSPK